MEPQGGQVIGRSDYEPQGPGFQSSYMLPALYAKQIDIENKHLVRKCKLVGGQKVIDHEGQIK